MLPRNPRPFGQGEHKDVTTPHADDTEIQMQISPQQLPNPAQRRGTDLGSLHDWFVARTARLPHPSRESQRAHALLLLPLLLPPF